MTIKLFPTCGVKDGYETAGHVVEHRLDEVWRARIRAAYALPGIA